MARYKKKQEISPLTLQTGADLRKIRKAKGVSLRDWSESSGIPRSYLSNIENGKLSVSLDTLERIAQTLNIRVLVGYDDISIPTKRKK